jgi:ABC-2 type transport system ATP-binding protein
MRRVREIMEYSSQEAGVDENATGREYLGLCGSYYHLDAKTIKRRTDEVLELIKLADATDRLVGTYSGGMRKCLKIATALINQPKLLIFDEPTLRLDVQTRLRVWDYIRKLKKEDTTILMTTHYLGETNKLCDRLAIIDHGQIVAIGTPDELKEEIRGGVVALTLPLQEPEQQAKTVEQAKQLLTPQSFVKDVRATSEELNVYC